MLSLCFNINFTVNIFRYFKNQMNIIRNLIASCSLISSIIYLQLVYFSRFVHSPSISFSSVQFSRSLGFFNFLPSSALWSKSQKLTFIQFCNLLEEEAFLQRHQHKTVTVYNDKAHLKSDYDATDKVTWLLL